jgi:Fur family transcriptional regulator, zinc uptake regulator
MLYYNNSGKVPMSSKPSNKKALLKFAENMAEEKGHRWTDIRAQVYETLLESGQPLSAYELLEQVSKRYRRAVQPASVYRSLEALEALALIGKIQSLNAYIACRHPDHDHEHIFLVCDHCGQIDEIADHGISRQLVKDATSKGFKASRQILELHGNCKTCRHS